MDCHLVHIPRRTTCSKPRALVLSRTSGRPLSAHPTRRVPSQRLVPLPNFLVLPSGEGKPIRSARPGARDPALGGGFIRSVSGRNCSAVAQSGGDQAPRAAGLSFLRFYPSSESRRRRVDHPSPSLLRWARRGRACAPQPGLPSGQGQGRGRARHGKLGEAREWTMVGERAGWGEAWHGERRSRLIGGLGSDSLGGVLRMRGCGEDGLHREAAREEGELVRPGAPASAVEARIRAASAVEGSDACSMQMKKEMREATVCGGELEFPAQ